MQAVETSNTKSSSAPLKSDLNIHSKEYKVPGSPAFPEDDLERKASLSETSPEPEQAKKSKKKKSRSNKGRKSKQAAQNNFVFDPMLRQQLLYSMEQMNDTSAGFSNNFMQNPQVQSLIQTINDQVLAQQQ